MSELPKQTIGFRSVSLHMPSPRSLYFLCAFQNTSFALPKASDLAARRCLWSESCAYPSTSLPWQRSASAWSKRPNGLQCVRSDWITILGYQGHALNRPRKQTWWMAMLMLFVSMPLEEAPPVTLSPSTSHYIHCDARWPSLRTRRSCRSSRSAVTREVNPSRRLEAGWMPKWWEGLGEETWRDMKTSNDKHGHTYTWPKQPTRSTRLVISGKHCSPTPKNILAYSSWSAKCSGLVFAR